MGKQRTRATSTPIRAAGGIVLGTGANKSRIALVRRSRYGPEIALPKGKLHRGEDAATGALREVAEETGCAVTIRHYAGTVRYAVGARPKEVTYFLMDSDGAGLGLQGTGEIEGVEWVTPREALRRLTHEDDRELIATVFNLARSGAKSRRPSVKRKGD